MELTRGGSDFGFWPALDCLQDDVRAGEVLKVNDMSEVPSGFNGYVMHVSDNGNVTLYEPNVVYKKVWGVV